MLNLFSASSRFRVVETVLTVPAFWHIVSISWVFAARLTYPMDIEWMEGGVLLHAHRFMHGDPVYGPPWGGFLPFPYPPLHFVFLAAIGKFATLDYSVGRAVSIAFFTMACAVVFIEIRRSASGSRAGMPLAIVGTGLSVASFPVVGGWYDLVRNDSMAIAFPLLGAMVLIETPLTRVRMITGAFLLAASVYTKQTGVFFIAWIVVFLTLRNRREGLWVAGLTFFICATALAVALAATHRFFWLYVFDEMLAEALVPRRGLEGVAMIVRFAPYIVGLPLFLVLAAKKGWLSARTVLWAGMLVSALPASLLPYAKTGGFLNNLIPVAFLSGPVLILVITDVIRGPAASWRDVTYWTTMATASVWLASHAYNPKTFVPTAVEWDHAFALNDFIASLPNGVVIPSHPFLAVRNGQPTPQFHDMAYTDALDGGLERLDLPSYLKNGQAEWAILSGTENPSVLGWIHQVYAPLTQPVPAALLAPLPRVFTMTGFRTGPSELLRVRRSVARRGSHPVFGRNGTEDGEWLSTGTVVATPGRGTVSTNGPQLADQAVGTLTSPRFTLDRTHLGFLIAGGRNASTRVELQVGGGGVQRTTGIRSNVPIEVIWDVGTLRGHSAQIVLVDEETARFGYISVGDIELFDVEE